MHNQVGKPFDWATPLPKFKRLRKDFSWPVARDIQLAVAQTIDGFPEAASLIRECEGQPVIIPSMGSHGGSTAVGRVLVLGGLGITENFKPSVVRSHSVSITRDNSNLFQS